MKYLTIITFILSLNAFANSADVFKIKKSMIQDVVHEESGVTSVDLVRDPSLSIIDGVVIIDLTTAFKLEEILLENGESIRIDGIKKVVGGDGDSGGN